MGRQLASACFAEAIWHRQGRNRRTGGVLCWLILGCILILGYLRKVPLPHWLVNCCLGWQKQRFLIYFKTTGRRLVWLRCSRGQGLVGENGVENSTWIKWWHQAPNLSKSDTSQISSNSWSMMLIWDSATAASTLRLGTGENRRWLHGVLGIWLAWNLDSNWPRLERWCHRWMQVGGWVWVSTQYERGLASRDISRFPPAYLL